MKNNKKIFFVLTLLTLLIAVSTVNTVDNTTVADDTTTINDASSAEVVQTGTNEQAVATKNMEKEEKNIKKDSIIIDGIEYSGIIENQEISNQMYPDEATLINNCTLNYPSQDMWDAGIMSFDYPLYINNSLINTGLMLVKDTVINSSVVNGYMLEDQKIIFYNSTLNSTIDCTGNIIIDANCVIGENFNSVGSATIDTNKTEVIELVEETNIKMGIYNFDKTFENTTITSEMIITNYGITNNANMEIINCTIKEIYLVNNGNLTLRDLEIGSDVRMPFIRSIAISKI